MSQEKADPTPMERQLTREQPPIFTELRLRNFKSIREARIPLHSLTVVVGANSSGKSTLLQALLALAQTVRGEVGTDRISLNGEYVQLGEFREVLSFGADPSHGISVGLSAEVSASRPQLRAPRPFTGGRSSTLAWDANFESPADPTNGYALLRSVAFELSERERGSRFQLAVASVKPSSASIGDPRFDDPFGSITGPMLEVDGRITGYQTGEGSTTLDRVRFWGGIPERVTVRVDRFRLFADNWWDAYAGDSSENLRPIRAELRRGSDEFRDQVARSRQAAVTTAAKEIKELCEEFLDSDESGSEAEDSAPDATEIKRVFKDNARRRSEREREKILLSMAFLDMHEFQKSLRQKIGNIPALNGVGASDLAGDLGTVVRNTSRYLRFSLRAIKYLGPLREAPKALYDPSPDRSDIGTRGEFAAAVLDAHARDMVRCPLPAGGQTVMPLGEALNLWLAELGLAERAQAKDLGRLGMSLSVVPKGMDKLIDLTAVGVGVSQVMPVILQCLWARPNSLILLEQPELHLHPAMQLKLADFLLACSRTGRQIIIETHSEHIVNRLRRRVADDSSGSLSRSIGLLFAEQESGESQYRTTTISPSGGLSQGWPKGFLDVGSNEADEFLAEALRRRRDAGQSSDQLLK